MMLNERYRQMLLHIFGAEKYPFEIWAYGSRVNGTAHEGSDLDLVIRSRDLSPVPGDIFYTLYEKIKDSNIPILVEMRDWARLPERFHKNIEERYEILFDNREVK